MDHCKSSVEEDHRLGKSASRPVIPTLQTFEMHREISFSLLLAHVIIKAYESPLAREVETVEKPEENQHCERNMDVLRVDFLERKGEKATDDGDTPPLEQEGVVAHAVDCRLDEFEMFELSFHRCLTARRERVIPVAVALLNFAVFAVNEVFRIALLGNLLASVKRIIFRVMRRKRLVAAFALVLPHVTVGVVNSVNVLCHII